MKKGTYWSPYVAGALSGLVSIASVWITGKYLGASTTFVKTAAMIESTVDPNRVLQMPYFIKNTATIDWQWMFIVGVAIGAFIAAILSGTFQWKKLPDLWESRFGLAYKKRAIIAFIGGIIAMFGARLADGCPSGHGLSGGLQLSVSGYVALVCFFIGGLISANILYRKGEK